uniref:Uncharacterized protein n=1 Tax=Alexandrium catenella TaxID=2925 RepID=A0A7S1RFE8_ALECA
MSGDDPSGNKDESPSAVYDDDGFETSPVTSPNSTLKRPVEPDSSVLSPASRGSSSAPDDSPTRDTAADSPVASTPAAQPAAAAPATAAAAEPTAAVPASASAAPAAEPATAPAPAAEPAPAAAVAEPMPAPVASAAAAAPPPEIREAVHDEVPEIPDDGDALDEGDHHPSSPAAGSEKSLSRTSPKSKSMSALGSYSDLKKKTSFANVATEGVKKDGTYMIHFSNFKTGPKFSMGTRTPSGFMRSSDAPAPGSYTLMNEDKSKYTAQPRFSFGGCARFGLGQSPTKKAPGPGAYNPKDPTLNMEVKVGFGSSNRKGLVSSHNPGPGAYEARPGGSSPMFTAGGRHPTNINRSRSQPGPGAYTPNSGQVFNATPKCGFGTSTRTDHAARSRNSTMPGPGTYEMQNFRSTGSDAPKYSATSRRRVHDLDSYVTPGPGSYNSHVTSFGY